MNRRMPLPLLMVLTVLMSQFLAACGPFQSARNGNPGGAGQPHSPNTLEGTSDSGGGNGVEGKVLESYIFNPAETAAFKEFLGPLLKQIKSTEPGDEGDISDMFLYRTWYLAPVEFSQISKQTLGVSFLKTNTQQLARQTMKEVWINKKLWDKMSTREQGELLLHEMVMTFYFFKFMKLSEHCQLLAQVAKMKGQKDEGCEGNVELMDKLLPPAKQEPLAERDYENIRYVTGWILQNASKGINDQDLNRVMRLRGFDPRVFQTDDKDKKEPPPEIKVTSEQLMQILKGSEASGFWPSTCVDDKGLNIPCQIEFSQSSTSYRGVSLSSLRMNVTANDEKLSAEFVIGSEVALSASEDLKAGLIYSLALPDLRDRVRVGDRTSSVFLFFERKSNKPEAALVLKSVVIKPGVVMSVDKSRNPVCQLIEPKPMKNLDRSLAVIRSDSSLSVTESIYLDHFASFLHCDGNTVTY